MVEIAVKGPDVLLKACRIGVPWPRRRARRVQAAGSPTEVGRPSYTAAPATGTPARPKQLRGSCHAGFARSRAAHPGGPLTTMTCGESVLISSMRQWPPGRRFARPGHVDSAEPRQLLSGALIRRDMVESRPPSRRDTRRTGAPLDRAPRYFASSASAVSARRLPRAADSQTPLPADGTPPVSATAAPSRMIRAPGPLLHRIDRSDVVLVHGAVVDVHVWFQCHELGIGCGIVHFRQLPDENGIAKRRREKLDRVPFRNAVAADQLVWCERVQQHLRRSASGKHPSHGR